MEGWRQRRLGEKVRTHREEKQKRDDSDRPSHGRTWELLRFHSKLEKSSDEVEDVKDDRPIDPAHKAIDLLASPVTL
jgi:hypothetical protein